MSTTQPRERIDNRFSRRRTALFRCLMMGALLVATGCAGSAWRSALDEDTPASYYRFMREHGESKYAERARERLDFHKLKRNPTLAGFETFRKQYPDSELIEALHPALERPAFDAALAQGTAEAYRDFLEKFARGAMAARAEGNAVYVEADGFGGNAAQLAEFAAAYPESDFAAEAARTAAAVAARQMGSFTRIGLELQIDPALPEAHRVREALLDRIRDMTERRGVEVVEVPTALWGASDPRLPEARLQVTHSEKAVDHQPVKGQLVRPAMLGVTRLVLRAGAEGEVIADQSFSVRVEDKAHVSGTSVLFSAASKKYWSEFYVPVASWRNDQTIRAEIALEHPVVDVQGVGERSVVLYENGDFDLIGLADPEAPVQLASYQRSERLKKWSGVRLVGDRVVIYGEEGLEFVRFTALGPVAERTWSRGEIGRVLSVAPVAEQLVIVGAKGMQILDLGTLEIKRGMRRVMQSIDSAGDTLIFADGESVYLSNLELLAQNRVIAQMRLGKTFGPDNVRVLEHNAIVTGPGGVIVIDMQNPNAPKALAKFSAREIGEVVDATRLRGRTFLLGRRGLQILDRSLQGVEETIDVGERNRVSVMGRHLVIADGSSLRVVDATPWATDSLPAAKADAGAPDALLNGSGF